jgi:L,D-transpeptidase YbiS
VDAAAGGRPAAPAGQPRRLVVAAAGALVVLAAAVLVAGTGYRYEPYAEQPLTISSDIPAETRPLQQFTVRLRTRQRALSVRLDGLRPKGVYIVIDQTQNRLYLKRGTDTLLQAVCSAGSGMVLRESGGRNREWVFDSPRGRFEVRTMLKDPVWRKPDWAFVEEGEPIPKNPADRLDYGTLGEYALYFGDGFMIHGTLYERLLGRAVSHGCIRVGRDDLRKVWANAKIGTQIFIY